MDGETDRCGKWEGRGGGGVGGEGKRWILQFKEKKRRFYTFAEGNPIYNPM